MLGIFSSRDGDEVAETSHRLQKRPVLRPTRELPAGFGLVGPVARQFAMVGSQASNAPATAGQKKQEFKDPFPLLLDEGGRRQALGWNR